MTASLHSSRQAFEERLAELILSLAPYESEMVRFSRDGDDLVLEGPIASYEAKCRVEGAARAAGFHVHNSLRVTPGIVSDIASTHRNRSSTHHWR